MTTATRACRGCGVQYDAYTTGCRQCIFRHSTRRLKGSGRLTAARPDFGQRVCHCGRAFIATHPRQSQCEPNCRDASSRTRHWVVANEERDRRNKLKWHLRKYDLMLEEYDALVAAQDGRCAICGTDDSSPFPRFGVDHDHNTGEVRGLLCHNCNSCIGRAKDDPELLRKAIAYLERAR